MDVSEVTTPRIRRHGVYVTPQTVVALLATGVRWL